MIPRIYALVSYSFVLICLNSVYLKLPRENTKIVGTRRQVYPGKGTGAVNEGRHYARLQGKITTRVLVSRLGLP